MIDLELIKGKKSLRPYLASNAVRHALQISTRQQLKMVWAAGTSLQDKNIKIRFGETTWHTLKDLVRKPTAFPAGRQVVKPARKDMIEKVMSGVYRAVEAELIRMHMG